MKMRKIMAAGIAATMAVTSMAAVASAKEISFNMLQKTYSYGLSKSATLEYADTTIKATIDNNGKVTGPLAAASDILLVKSEVTKGNTTVKLDGVTLSLSGLKKVDTAPAFNASQDYAFIPVWTDWNLVNAGADADAQAAAVKAIADQIREAQLTNGAIAGSADLKNADAATATWSLTEKAGLTKYFALINYADYAGEKAFIGSHWVEVDKLTLKATAPGESNLTEQTTKTSVDVDSVINVAANFNGSTDLLLKSIKPLAAYVQDLDVVNKAEAEKYGFMPMTTVNENDTIYRNNVMLLSDADDRDATTIGGGDYSDGDTGFGQTYDPASGLGLKPFGFAGLASQVADFFNHQTNGTITMKFTPDTTAAAGIPGGIPSTQVGLRADLEANNFALFVNYRASSGGLQALTSVNKKDGTVTFDISEILADLGGQTKGVVQDIFYGLNQYIDYKDYGKGLLVEQVTLAYEEEATEGDLPDPDDDPIDDEDPVDDPAEDPAEDPTEDPDAELDDEDPVDDEDPAEDVAGDMFEEEEPADEDENPGTGVALAVVPAMIAAAAVVVSKKRK